MTSRTSGVLFHPTSLPSKYGIGSMGKEARVFVDWLAANGQSIWQILPLGPTDFSHSPYQCYSAFAGNSDLIDLDDLYQQGWFPEPIKGPSKAFPLAVIDFHQVRKFREPILRKSFEQFKIQGGFDSHSYHQFWNEHGWWLDSYSQFYAFRKKLKGKDWSEWEIDLRDRKDEVVHRHVVQFSEDIAYQRFLQFVFFQQWFALKRYANERGIEILGDIPLYVSYDSADVWANPDIFWLDGDKKPVAVGGVPPDYFSETGQLWGNPLYDWDRLQHRQYDWWIARLHFNLHLFDKVRIDHFRGLESFWAVPAGEKTAVNGSWKAAHGDALLALLQQQIGLLPVIAEDLGTITPDVHRLRKKYRLPGMKVLQFAFTSDASNEHLPHNYETDFVAYTGTHDNDTSLGWLKKIKGEERERCRSYLGSVGSDPWKLIRAVLGSVAQTAILPLQDLLSLDDSARMNTPGTITGNWQWRMEDLNQLAEPGQKLKALTTLYGREQRLQE